MWLRSVAKKVMYGIALLILFMAVVVSVGHLFTPVLDRHRADIEKWASALLGMPVTIHQVHLSWHSYQPEITLEEVTILNKTTQAPLLQIQKVSVFFSIPQSLWQRTLVPNGMMLSGTSLNMHKSVNGDISIQGFPLGQYREKPFENETKFTDLMAWIYSQNRLLLSDVDVHYTDFLGEKRFVTLYQLNITNSGTAHHLSGKAILRQDLPTEVTWAVDAGGDATDLSKMKAKIYLYVAGLSLSPWLNGYTWKGWQIRDGIASIKLWATWNGRLFEKIQTLFRLYNVSLYSKTDHSVHNINRFSGNIGWKQDDQEQIFAGDDILIDLPSHLWPVTNFYVSFASRANHILALKAVNLGYVDVSDIQPFLFSSPAFLPEATHHLLTALKVTGHLQDAAIVFSGAWTDWEHASLNASFTELSVLPWQQWPGLSHLSGTLKWNGTQGDVSLHSYRAVLRDDRFFSTPIFIDQLTGDILFQYDKNQWAIQLSSLQGLNTELSLNMSGRINLPPNASPIVDVKTHFTLQKVDHLTRYLPLRTFEPGLVKWLKEAFLSGEVQSGDMTLQGSLSDFPFDTGKGRFVISTQVNNVDFHYAPEWPLMQQVSGQLIFSGRKMTIDVKHAFILDIPIAHVHGEIPYFGDAGPQILHVQTSIIPADLAQGLRFIHQSPLEETLGRMFSNVDVRGPMTLTLGLIIPLGNPDKTQVQGDVAIQDTQMNFVPWHLTLDHLRGLLHFTEAVTESNNIQGQLFNQPLTLNFSTKKINDATMVQVNFTNHLNLSEVEQWLKFPFPKDIQGSTDVTGTANFSLNTPVQVHVVSQLVGLSSTFPKPYAKKAGEAKDFSADITVQDDEPLKVKLNYDNALSAALILKHQEDKFDLVGATLHLGRGDPSWPAGSGLYITGNIDQLDWNNIKTYMNQSNHVTIANLVLQSVDIQANVLMIGNQRLMKVNLQVLPSSNSWTINIDSPELVGQIKAPTRFNSKEQISAQFQRVNLHSESNTASNDSGIDFKSLPAISLVANNVRYNDMVLGQVSFKTVSSPQGLSLQTFNITSSVLDLRATGGWTSQNVTNLQGVAKSSNVSDLLTYLGVGGRNLIASNGRLNFNLSWHGAPYAPTLRNLQGRASLELGKGRIVDIGEANGAKMDIGRMLNIFSLQTIPRRLSLDFSDVFQKGYSFDSLQGKLTFRQGNTYTNDLRFDGPVARVSINGRIGLQDKDYDFTLSVTPHVTSSLPVAATLVTGQPLIGLAALAVNTVLSSGVSKVTTYYYSVKGPWDNPSWQSVPEQK